MQNSPFEIYSYMFYIVYSNMGQKVIFTGRPHKTYPVML